MKHAAWFLVALAALAGSVAARDSGSAAVSDAAVLTEGAFPRKLSDYGFFADPRRQTPRAGVISYRLNTPLYSDGAEKLRFVYIPQGMQARARGEGLLDLPVGSALIKTFTFGEGGERKLIETRVLLHRAQGWVALPYLWNAAQSEARLALAGARVPVTTPSGEAITYRVPNKNQCKECHGVDGAVIPIGTKARNLSREWLDRFVLAGHLNEAPEISAPLPVWEKRADAPAETAARAYLDVNCAHCHRPGASASNSGLDLRWEQTDPQALGIMKRPVAAGRGSGELLFDVVPGKPDQSILVHRMRSTEPGVAMPELGKATVDQAGVEAIERWVAGL